MSGFYSRIICISWTENKQIEIYDKFCDVYPPLLFLLVDIFIIDVLVLLRDECIEMKTQQPK